MSRLLIAISNGFEEIEAVSIIDICRRAEIEVTIASIDSYDLMGAHNILIKADALIEDVKAEDFEMIVLPGGLPNAYNLAKNKTLKNLLNDFNNLNKRIGAICAAPVALNEAKVLKGKYTCYPSFEKEIGEENYISDENIVQNENIITSRGPGTAMEFALELVKTLKDEETAQNLAKGLLFK